MDISSKLRFLAAVALMPAICLMPGKALAITLVSDTLKSDPNFKAVLLNNNGLKTIKSGDFSISSGHNALLGDGVDESTKWTFDFSPVSTRINRKLESAILDLTITNSDSRITTDSIGIDGLGSVSVTSIKTVSGDPLLSQLPRGQAKAVQLDLLKHSSFTDPAIRDLFNRNNGVIKMHYQDDAIISSARLTLKTVPEPSAGAGLLVLGAIGASSLLKRQRQKKALEDILS